MRKVQWINDNNHDDGAMMIFISDSGLGLFRTYSRWAADGTFSTCPSLFYQINNGENLCNNYFDRAPVEFLESIANLYHN